MPPRYVELHCHSAFSLLDGASLPEALVARAAALGMPALALTDHDDLGGIVRFAQAAREAGIGGIVGAELTHEADAMADWRTGGMADGDPAIGSPPSRDARSAHRSARPPVRPSALRSSYHLPLLCESAEGYANLCTLITRARMDAARGTPAVSLEVLAQHTDGLVALTGSARGWVPSRLAAGDERGACDALALLRDLFGGRVVVECQDHGLPEERALAASLIALAEAFGLPWIVANDVHYADPEGRMIHDVLCALRHGKPLDQMGTRLRPNGEWYLKGYEQLRFRWRERPEGLHNTVAVAERCAFRLEQLRPSLPHFPLPPGVTADEYLARLVARGAGERWADAGAGERTGGRADGCSVREPPPAHDVQSASPPDRQSARAARARRAQLRHELALIAKLGYAGFFLIVWDIVRYAARHGILVQGRGSAANSAVCYCLGITVIDPVAMGLLFERFLSEERQEPPDIDLDVAHEHREQVLQYIYEKYGRDHAAMVCEQITYRGRSAVKDAARVLGFSVEQAEALAAYADRYSAQATAAALRAEADGRTSGLADWAAPDRADLRMREERPSARPPDRPSASEPARLSALLGSHLAPGTEATTRAREVKEQTRRAYAVHGNPNAQASGAKANDWGRSTPPSARPPVRPSAAPEAPQALAGLDPADPRVRRLADIVEGLHQLPRHRSIHVGGFVLTREPLHRHVPIEPASMPGRTVIQWEKDDLDPVGLIKIDVLGLGMLSLLQRALRYVRQVRGVTLDLGQLDYADPAVYDMLCAADTIGVFQVESRAQMNTLPRHKPRCFYDLVVEVALIRPGPIQGDMVHPYLRRRAGEEPVTYLHPSLEPILRRTLGVPLFQEQGMQVAIAAAGFSAGEADTLRRAMGHKRSRERMAEICEKLVAGMARNGIPPETARRIYDQINAFADYGFPESHAASFATLVYASAYLKHYYAPEFTAALLNAQPMGFYAPGTIIDDARRHGVEVRGVCLARSGWETGFEKADGQPWADGRTGGLADWASRTGGRSRTERPSASPLVRPSATASVRPSALRLGLRLVRGLGARAREALQRAREGGPFTSVADVVHRTGLDRGSLRALAEAGAFDAFVPGEPDLRKRRAALWQVLEAARGTPGPLFPTPAPTPAPALPPMAPWELTEADYRLTTLSLNGHPMGHLRPWLRTLGVRSAAELTAQGRPQPADARADGRTGGQADGGAVPGQPPARDARSARPPVRPSASESARPPDRPSALLVAGLVICRQRPGTAKGFVFLTLEDETGLVNVVIRPDLFERQALLISRSPLLLVRGDLQVEAGVVNIRARECEALVAKAGEGWVRSRDFR
ncbi:MAG: PHP domain-containing protein [Gemmatimonadales bacterium]|nr:PHP domain-containing protein [Gemmatimonadales bacterium]